jgi:FAD-dependent halogenase
MARARKVSPGPALSSNEPGSVHWPKDPEAALRDVIGRYAYLRVRFEHAVQVKPIRVLRNLPYHATRLVGEGFALTGDAAFFVDPIHSSGVHLAFYSAAALADAVHAHLGGDRRALDVYVRKVARHHRMVRYNVALYYRVVVRYRAIAWMFVWMTGRLFRNWSGPWLNRINAWSFGHYSSFSVALGLLWAMALIGRTGTSVILKVLGWSGWGRHGYPAAPASSFDIPRSPELEAARSRRRHSVGDGQIEPRIVATERDAVSA